MTEREEREARAEQRRARLLALAQGSGADEDDGDQPRAGDAMGLSWELTRIAWAFSRRPMPTLPRSEWPCRLVSLRDAKA